MKKAGRIIMVAALVLAMCMTGCAKSTKSEKTDGKSDFHGEFIISAEEAVEKMNDKDVLFVDARGEKEAGKGTVDGAIATLWTDISIQDGKAGDETWCLVPEPDRFEPLLQNLGIEKDREIIVLGEPEGGWGEDGRVLWELRQAGCTNIKFVDGGITAMKDIGAEFVKGAASPEKSDIEVKELDKSHDITTEELQENYDDYKIIDVRVPKEYEGATLYGEAQGGHLPGAINIPYIDLFQKDGTLKSNDEITKMFEDKGVQKTDKIVTYCTGGIRSAYVQLVLEMCGYEDTYSYCQSFWRWAVVGEVEK